MKAFYSDTFVLPLPPEHRFPMAKYRLLRERLMEEEVVAADLAIPEAATDEQLARVHSRVYLARVVGGGLDRVEVRRLSVRHPSDLDHSSSLRV